jgi:hypothetical protein
MSNENDRPTIIDLDEYPGDTDKILVAMLKKEESDDYGDLENRHSLAQKTELTKHQVRYRLEKLLENNEIELHWVDEYDNVVAYYELKKSSRQTAKSVQATTEILGKLPDEITRQDILHLMHHFVRLQKHPDSIKLNETIPAFFHEAQEWRDYIEAKVNTLEDTIAALEEDNHNLRIKIGYLEQLEDARGTSVEDIK